MRLLPTLLSGALMLAAQDVQSHLARGTAHMQRFVPGQVSPENLEHARLAASEFESALRLDPNSAAATRLMAQLSFHKAGAMPSMEEKMAGLEEAERWYRRLAALEPRSKDSHYSLGVIAWSRAYPEAMQARARVSMRPEDPPPIRDTYTRNELYARIATVLQDGIRHLEHALEIDPKYDDAMAYLNLLYRLRADVSGSQDEAKRDIATADGWVQKALMEKKAKAEAGIVGTVGSIAPPPPPAPVPSIGVSQTANIPRQIRIGGNVQQAKLINAPAAHYPELASRARIQGVVRFQVTVLEDGRVGGVTLISGHPLLVQSATDAVKQYLYQPTLLNGVPVQVVTTVDVNFGL